MAIMIKALAFQTFDAINSSYFTFKDLHETTLSMTSYIIIVASQLNKKGKPLKSASQIQKQNEGIQNNEIPYYNLLYLQTRMQYWKRVKDVPEKYAHWKMQ